MPRLNVAEQNIVLRDRINDKLLSDLDVSAVNVLRRAEQVLNREDTLECGVRDSGSGSYTISVERDDETGIAFKRIQGNGRDDRVPHPNRLGGAMNRIESVCREFGLYYYHQSDPRGVSLYVGREPLTSQNYNSHGVPVYTSR